MALNLYTVPPHIPFLEAIARGWLSRGDHPEGKDPLTVSRGLILLPTRRSARGLADAFLFVRDGAPMLLPRITALGALDEAPLSLTGALDLPPAVEPMQRLAQLSRLILAMGGRGGAPATADRAWLLARELASLMDEADRAGIDLRATLPDAADPQFAEHWKVTLQFLHIVTDKWPDWLADNGVMNPAARQVALLEAQARAWEDTPPDYPVLVAGTTAGIPAVARLLRAVARMPNGRVVLPQLDMGMDHEAWATLLPTDSQPGETSHAQAGLARLLADLGATRDDVRVWPQQNAGPASSPIPSWSAKGDQPRLGRHAEAAAKGQFPPQSEDVGGRPSPTMMGLEAPPPSDDPCVDGQGEPGHDGGAWNDEHDRAGVPVDRFPVLSRALLPASALNDWMRRDPIELDGITRLRAADQQQEAQAIALVLRDAVQTPGARAALVTPDRALAGRVAAALLRYGIVADDSAGEPLQDCPPAVFLRLLARAVSEELAPVPLLALLKHPLTGAGMHQAACRDAARRLERLCLRGPRLAPGLGNLRKAVDRAAGVDSPSSVFLARLESCLEPAFRFDSAVAIPPVEALSAVIEAAERLAATDTEAGSSRLWAAEEGDALATRLTEVREAMATLPDLKRGVLPGLLDAILEGEVVRSRRAVRGRGGFEHPRVFIWGLLEARLQSADVIVLGGLAETVWPPAAEPGPWLSRPMRRKVGLPSPEEAVGQAAHDFLSACCSAPKVVLSCPERRDNAPAVPARWLTRLDMFLAGRDLTMPVSPASAWAAAMDLPHGPPVPVKPPAPRPPVGKRPRRLSVTAIETWLRDPYEIHAKYILKLVALKPLDEETDNADYGLLVHEGLQHFLGENGANWPPDAAERLRRSMRIVLGNAKLRPALSAWWEPRLDRIADWVAAVEDVRRAARTPVGIVSEAKGSILLDRPGRLFELTGRADRIERYADGSLAIVDYKTGTPPTQTDVDAGKAPQLLLEAMMAADSGFGADWRGSTSALEYWHLTGGYVPGEVRELFKKAALAIPAAGADAKDRLCDLIDAFDDPDRAYLSRPQPAMAPRFSDYEQLARVAEWSSAGDGDE